MSNVGDIGGGGEVSLWKYFVIGCCFSFNWLRLLLLISFFVTFIHDRMDCSFIILNSAMSLPNHFLS